MTQGTLSLVLGSFSTRQGAAPVPQQTAGAPPQVRAAEAGAGSRPSGPVTWTKLITLGLSVLSHKVKTRITMPTSQDRHER